MDTISCRLCGDAKPKDEFTTMLNFTKYKKHKVTWCHDCQKMYVEYKRGKLREEKLKSIQPVFEVSFD